YRVTPNRSVVLNALINHCSPLLTQSIIECIYHPFGESWRFLNYKNLVNCIFLYALWFYLPSGTKRE
ncbi:unnamed protein product, partial [Brassica oleracea]